VGKEKSLNVPKIVLEVSRRIHLVELTARYMEDTQAEKAASEQRRIEAKKIASKKRQPTVKETYVDLLFPHTIQYKSKKTRKGKKDTLSDQKGQQVSEEEVIGEEVSMREERKKAERRIEYFIRLGTPLWRFSKCYGPSILAVLPKEVTESR
jgi:hypothetical protein